MRKLALLAVASIAFVACQSKTEEAAPAVDTTAVAPAADSAVVDSAATDSAKTDSAVVDSAK